MDTRPDGGWKTQRWTQFGVRFESKSVPGDDRPGILSPETASGKSAGMARGLDLTGGAVRTEELYVPGDECPIPVSVYRPAAAGTGDTPAVVYFHGGAFRSGSRDSVEPPLKLLCQKAGVAVFNVEYRLAPEFRYPCAADDCWRAVKYVHRHARELGVDPGNITVCGDSAGGALAAVCSRRDRNFRTRMIRRQALIYPVTALYDPVGEDDYSFSLGGYTFDDAYSGRIIPHIRALEALSSMPGLYTSSAAEARLPDVSPLADTGFAGLPETLILSAEFDFLLEQGKTYARRLARAGTAVRMVIYRGMLHGFMNFTGVFPQAEDLVGEIAGFIFERVEKSL